MNTKFLGKWGESLAAEYLRKKKYKITAAGYKTKFGEIDLIAENRKFVVFVEVKLRKDASVASAAEFVDIHKRKRVITAASQWIAAENTDKQPRFDVIEIYAPNGTETENPVINHMENAFGEDF